MSDVVKEIYTSQNTTSASYELRTNVDSVRFYFIPFTGFEQPCTVRIRSVAQNKYD